MLRCDPSFVQEETAAPFITRSSSFPRTRRMIAFVVKRERSNHVPLILHLTESWSNLFEREVKTALPLNYPPRLGPIEVSLIGLLKCLPPTEPRFDLIQSTPFSCLVCKERGAYEVARIAASWHSRSQYDDLSYHHDLNPFMCFSADTATKLRLIICYCLRNGKNNNSATQNRVALKSYSYLTAATNCCAN